MTVDIISRSSYTSGFTLNFSFPLPFCPVRPVSHFCDVLVLLPLQSQMPAFLLAFVFPRLMQCAASLWLSALLALCLVGQCGDVHEQSGSSDHR